MLGCALHPVRFAKPEVRWLALAPCLHVPPYPSGALCALGEQRRLNKFPSLREPLPLRCALRVRGLVAPSAARTCKRSELPSACTKCSSIALTPSNRRLLCYSINLLRKFIKGAEEIYKGPNPCSLRSKQASRLFACTYVLGCWSALAPRTRTCKCQRRRRSQTRSLPTPKGLRLHVRAALNKKRGLGFAKPMRRGRVA